MKIEKQYVPSLSMSNIEDEMRNFFVNGYVGKQIVAVPHLQSLPHEIDVLKLDMLIAILCRKGEMTMVKDSTQYTIKENDIVICRHDNIYNNVTFSKDFEGSMLGFVGTLFTEMMGSAQMWKYVEYFNAHPVVHAGADEAQAVKVYIDLIASRMAQQQRIYREVILQSLVKAVAFEIFILIRDQVTHQEESKDSTRQGEMLFRRFVDMLNDGDMKRHNVRYYADVLDVTPKYLSSVCKRVTGRTASDWIEEHMVQNIEHLLRYSDMTVKEMSAYLDFPNISFFGKYVRLHLGMAPTAFRKTIK